MKKLFSLFAALTLSAGLWAETINGVKYIDAYGKEQTVDGVTKVTDASDQVTWNAGWYVVKGTNITLSQGAVCSGAVNLILADGAKLTVTGGNEAPGIKVSEDGNSLTIYGQTAQSGQLIAKGDIYGAAGIGGGNGGSGSNITINGGTVTANGGGYAAGIGGGETGSGSNITINAGQVTANGGAISAGIGGGHGGSGSYITINGGTVTANGGEEAAGIGGGAQGAGSYITINGGTVTATGGSSPYGSGSSIGSGYDSKTTASNIKVASYIIVKAGNNENPTDVITNTGGDLANDLADKRYATTEQPANALSFVQTEAIDEINAAIEGIDDTDILAVANQAKTDINAATTIVAVIFIKEQTLATISLATAKSSAVAEIDAAIEGIDDTDILAIANKAKEDIHIATTTEVVNNIKTQALAELAIPIKIYNSGKAAGLAEAAAALPTDPEGTTGHTVTITKGDKTLILVNPDKVTYGKQD